MVVEMTMAAMPPPIYIISEMYAGGTPRLTAPSKKMGKLSFTIYVSHQSRI
jgi:hypothetical protein